jgi:predicted RNA-binding protein associated with RNAse of E/G family
VWKVFTEGVFVHWYINVEAPIVRRPDGTGGGKFDTDDHGIDLVIPADGSPWRWKDVDDPEAMAAAGRITTAEAEQIHADADAVAALLDADDRWWQPWDRWRPGDPPPAPPAVRSSR